MYVKNKYFSLFLLFSLLSIALLPIHFLHSTTCCGLNRERIINFSQICTIGIDGARYILRRHKSSSLSCACSLQTILTAISFALLSSCLFLSLSVLITLSPSRAFAKEQIYP